MAEQAIVDLILRKLGSEPDLVIWKRPVGYGYTYRNTPLTYGVEGEPDLQGYLRAVPFAMPFHLEVKTPTGRRSAVQMKMHALLTSYGVFVATVRSADEAVAALNKARSIRDNIGRA